MVESFVFFGNVEYEPLSKDVEKRFFRLATNTIGGCGDVSEEARFESCFGSFFLELKDDGVQLCGEGECIDFRLTMYQNLWQFDGGDFIADGVKKSAEFGFRILFSENEGESQARTYAQAWNIVMRILTHLRGE